MTDFAFTVPAAKEQVQTLLCVLFYLTNRISSLFCAWNFVTNALIEFDAFRNLLQYHNT